MPAGTGDATVAVANPGTAPAVAAARFAYQVSSATIASFTPSRGSRFGDTRVRIDGTGFFALTDVFFGTQKIDRGRVTVLSATSIEALSPEHAPGTVKISVQNPGTAQATSASDYTYEAFAIASATPLTGSICGGAQIKVTGTSFHDGLEVRFGTFLSPDVVFGSEGEIFAYAPSVPEGTGQVRIEATYGGLTVQGPNFVFRNLEFIRGDTNGNGAVNREDAELLLSFVHGTANLGAPVDAADADDNGVVNTADVYYLYSYLYGQGTAPKAPFPNPGQDPTPDSLTGCAGE